MRQILLTFFAGLYTFVGYCQSVEWQPKTREVIVRQGDSSIHISLLIKEEPIKINNSLTYYWYNKGQINYNQGDFAGVLLHGEYLVFNKDKKLVTKGKVEKGLKVGTWKSWHDNGKLKSIENYSKGLLDGECSFFYWNGELIRQVYFKNGVQANEEKKGFSFFMPDNGNDSTNVENRKHEKPVPVENVLEENVQVEEIPVDSSKVENRRRQRK